MSKHIRFLGLLVFFSVLLNITILTQAVKPGASIQPTDNNMTFARAAHTATLLDDGRVMIAGGMQRDGVITDTAEAFDPLTNQFELIGTMTVGRVGHTATLLNDGRMLIIGGWERRKLLNTAEIFDPKTEQFSQTANLLSIRGGFTATRLNDGRVLVVGGEDANGNSLNSAEIYDSQVGKFVPAGTMKIGRKAHTATLLATGDVLIIGGSDGERVLASVEIYIAETGQFLPIGDMNFARHKHAVLRLSNENVLIIGGSNNRDWRGRYNSGELYDVTTQKFTLVNEMKYARFKLSDAVTLLNDGNVLVAGGAAQAEIFRPLSRDFEVVDGRMDGERFSMTTTRLQDGRVLILGGYDTNIVSTSQAWIYTP